MCKPTPRARVSSRKGLALLLMAAFLILTIASQANSQTNNVPALSYQAFDQLAQVYKSGGTAPNLVAQLNIAVRLIEEGRARQAQGDTVDAVNLENQARAIINQMAPTIAAAQHEAEQNATARVKNAIVEAILVVTISTTSFYGALLVWRWYEREKLFEMKIFAEATED